MVGINIARFLHFTNNRFEEKRNKLTFYSTFSEHMII